MNLLRKKQYGLVLKKNDQTLPAVRSTAAAAFANSDDDDTVDTDVLTSANASASTMRIRMQAKREHERALAEDPSIFDYDAIYDELQAKKNEKVAEQKKADRERKSKYAEQIINAHKRRILEQQSREERKQQKEREQEAGEFDEKEVFVTGAYRKQMEEMQKFREQEAVENRLDELTAVEKQKGGVWQGGFYRTLLNDLARDGKSAPADGNGEAIKKEIIDEDEQKASPSQTSAANRHSQKLKTLRKQVNDSDEELVTSGPFEGTSAQSKQPSNSEATKTKRLEKDPKKKSIYSDESEPDEPVEPEKQVTLKPGLNILPKPTKKPTKAEQYQKRFTPSPTHLANNSATDSADDSNSASESESKTRKGRGRQSRRERGTERRYRERSTEDSESRRYRKDNDSRAHTHRNEHGHRRKDNNDSRGHRHGAHSHSKDDKKRKGEQRKDEKDKKEGEEKEGVEKKPSNKPVTKEERLKILKEILKQRNTEKDIEEFRRRYLERKQNGTVTLPI